MGMRIAGMLRSDFSSRFSWEIMVEKRSPRGLRTWTEIHVTSQLHLKVKPETKEVAVEASRFGRHILATSPEVEAAIAYAAGDKETAPAGNFEAQSFFAGLCVQAEGVMAGIIAGHEKLKLESPWMDKAERDQRNIPW